VILAQAASLTVISQESLISWTILVFLLGLAAAWGGAMVRLGRVETDLKEVRIKSEIMEAKQVATATEVAVLTSTLGRIEASQARVEAAVLGQRHSA
jgi:hypothetical protein